MSKKVILIVLGVLIVAGGLLLYPKWSLFTSSRITSINSKTQTFFIDQPLQLDELADKLKSEGLIDDPEAFIKVGQFKGITELNIALGKYVVEPSTQYRTLLNGFKLNSAGNGNAEVEVEVTFNDCRDIQELAGKVSASLLLDSADLSDILDDPKVMKRYGFSAEQFPAMFLPNTYRMYYDTDGEEFLERMAEEFKKFWTDERLAKLGKVGLNSPSQAVTLASIVYSEQSRHADEWPIIAGLYLNRLNKGIKLQSDPTFKFCWGRELDNVQRLLNVHREIDCPYNTYRINGLPPGPICIPPSGVVDAVLNRAEVDYIFMCAKPDYSGKHNFAVSGDDHARNAEIFQKWLAAELKK